VVGIVGQREEGDSEFDSADLACLLFPPSFHFLLPPYPIGRNLPLPHLFPRIFLSVTTSFFLLLKHFFSIKSNFLLLFTLQTMLVDNSPHAYGYNLDNGVPIESWFDSKEDTELLKLIGFLKSTENIVDVRPLIRDHFGSSELVQRAALGYPQLITAPPF
jgi:NLI interacting factor-like phosphatase